MAEDLSRGRSHRRWRHLVGDRGQRWSLNSQSRTLLGASIVHPSRKKSWRSRQNSIELPKSKSNLRSGFSNKSRKRVSGRQANLFQFFRA